MLESKIADIGADRRALSWPWAPYMWNSSKRDRIMIRKREWSKKREAS
jgi:hypothetical protein